MASDDNPTEAEQEVMLLALSLAEAVLCDDAAEGEALMERVLAEAEALGLLRAVAGAAAGGWASLARCVWEDEAEARLQAIRMELVGGDWRSLLDEAER